MSLKGSSLNLKVFVELEQDLELMSLKYWK
jgi:hypothetical protein